jgi:predicted secreted hydrolase
MNHWPSRIAVLGLLLANLANHVFAEPSDKQLEGSTDGLAGAFSYPLNIGRLSFPKDEGKHSPSQWPNTLAEWHAHYAHLTAEDGTRYLLFTTFVTFDPVEPMIGGKFPHVIATLVDVTHGKTYRHRDMGPLKTFAFGHADVQTTNGDYFRWQGEAKPFQYEFHVAWREPLEAISVTTALKMVKPPLAVNGSGYIKLPKGDSGYYCQTRLETKGELTLNGITKKVAGIHWIDRQWLGMTFAANLNFYYDWWALQLDNNEEAILFRIKDFATNAVVMSVLEINHADGKRERVEGFVLTDLPSGWQLSAPGAGWELKIVPACKGQLTWQSCDITGTIHGKPVTGFAAAELARDALEEFRRALRPNQGRPTEKAGQSGGTLPAAGR